MLSETLSTLASAGGSALVTAMVTDCWESVRASFARLIGRSNVAEIKTAESWLDQSRATLEGASGSDLDRVRIDQEIVWRTRLSDMLERYPDVETELRDWIADLQNQVQGAGAAIKQNVSAFDHSQQAVQGQGIQNVTFGERSEPGRSKT